MLKMFGAILILASVVSCAQQERKYSTIDPAFNEYVMKFHEEGVRQNVNYTAPYVPVNFEKLADNPLGRTAGICRIYSNGRHEILIDPDFWARASEQHKIALIFHEMGHCALGRAHRDDVNEFNQPVSVMNKYLLSGSLFDQNYSRYIKELFTGEY